MPDGDELIALAAATGYTLSEGRWHGRPAWRWHGPGPKPFFLDRGRALRWVEDLLGRRRLS
jgi:hypothetical protein